MDFMKKDDNLYQSLPKVYQLDNFNDCMKGQNVFCKAIVKLHPTQGHENSSLWTAIRETKLDNRYYSRDRVFHGFCVPKTNITSTESVHKYYTSKFDTNQSYSEFQLLLCPTDEGKAPPIYDKFDIFLGLLIFGYVGLIIFATISDYLSSKNTHEVKPSLKAISLFANWKKTFSNNKISSKTAALQFFRIILMVVVIASHSCIIGTSSFVKNTEDIEKIFRLPFTIYILSAISMNVSIFFFMSSFLVSIQISEIYDSNSRFTVKDLLITALNRYLRLVVLVCLATVGILSTFLRTLVPDNGVNKATFYFEYKTCERYWWRNLLLIQNNYQDACFRVYWYAGAEMQLYIISLFVLYLVFKMKNHAYKIFGFFIVLSVVLQWSTLYYSKIEVAVENLIPDNFNIDALMISRSLLFIHTATTTNVTSYLIGLTVGYFYHQYKDLNLEKRKNSNKIWIFSSSSVITVTLILYVQTYSPTKITTPLISAILKPMFVTGIAIFILGLLFNVNSGVRLFCEQRAFQILAKFNYSMYLFHFFPMAFRFALLKDFTTLSVSYILFWIVMDVVTAFIIAVISHILVELPVSNLQKIWVPQVSKLKKSASKNE